MSGHRDIETTAAVWVGREEASDFSAADRERLHAWLDEDVAHRVAWLRLRSVWKRADRLASVRAATPPARRRRGAIRWAAAAAMGLVALLGNAVWHDGGTRYRTDIGDRRAVALVDGSSLELNTRTVVRTQVDHQTRTVWLERGEAFFDVKPDPLHPFVIHAGDHRVVVLGTKFSVRRDRDRFEVAVLEGSVRVESARQDPARPPVVVNGGALLIGKPAGTVVAVNARAKVQRALSWRHGILVFDQSTLAEAAAQFNRHNRRQLVLADAATAQIRIGGSFDATSVEAFARLLDTGFNLRVESRGGEIRVSQPE